MRAPRYSHCIIIAGLILACLINSNVTAAGIELIGDVSQATCDEMLDLFREGAPTFAGGYLFSKFESGLDKYIVSIENINGRYTVTTSGKPCHETRIYVRRNCFSETRCFWDVESAYLCLNEE